MGTSKKRPPLEVDTATKTDKVKRKRKRKLRTKSSSPSSSPPAAIQNHGSGDTEDVTTTVTATNQQGSTEPRKMNDEQIREAFQSYYLRKMTAELSDELDALRSAQDFTDASLPMLMAALKQGVDCFSLAERRTVVEGEFGLEGRRSE